MTTYYVDGLVGSDTNDGLAEGAGPVGSPVGSPIPSGAWKTFANAMSIGSVVVGGDTIFVKASTTYTGQLPTLTNYGSFALPIIMQGYTNTPGDGGRVTVSGGTYVMRTGATTPYWKISNFILTGASSHGFYVQNNAAIFWENCVFTGNGGHGTHGSGQRFYSCVFSLNSLAGNSGAVYMVGCTMTGNGQEGVYAAPSIFMNNLIYGLSLIHI